MQNGRKKLGWLVLFVALLAAAFAALQFGFAIFPYADPPPPVGMIERAWNGAIWSTIIAVVLMVIYVALLKSSRKTEHGI